MPRVKRQTFADVTIDRVTEEMLAMMGRLPARSPEQEIAAEKHADKFMRRLEKAQRRWRSMSAEEQREWTATYVAEQSRRAGKAKPPKVADLPMLYAIATVCEKDDEKARHEYSERQAARHAAEEQRKAEIAEARAAEPPKPPTARATRPSPELDESDEASDKPKRKRARRGPSVGVAGYQLPDGYFVSNDRRLYDDDDR